MYVQTKAACTKQDISNYVLSAQAMKMEYPVTAPHAGKVFEVLAAPSELAQQGDVLVSLEKGDKSAGTDAQRTEE